MIYANDGDWVESLTALAELPDGRLQILDWSLREEGLPVVALPSVAVAAGQGT